MLLSPSSYFHTQPHTVNTTMGECMSTCRWVAVYKFKFVLVLCIKWDSLVSVIFWCLSTKVYYFTFPVVFTSIPTTLFFVTIASRHKAFWENSKIGSQYTILVSTPTHIYLIYHIFSKELLTWHLSFPINNQQVAFICVILGWICLWSAPLVAKCFPRSCKPNRHPS